MEDKDITVTLKISELDVVLAGLGELPMKVALGVLSKIREQAAPQLAPPAETAAE